MKESPTIETKNGKGGELQGAEQFSTVLFLDSTHSRDSIGDPRFFGLVHQKGMLISLVNLLTIFT